MMKLWELTEKMEALQESVDMLATMVGSAEAEDEAMLDEVMETDKKVKQAQVDQEYLKIGDD